MWLSLFTAPFGIRFYRRHSKQKVQAECRNKRIKVCVCVCVKEKDGVSERECKHKKIKVIQSTVASQNIKRQLGIGSDVLSLSKSHIWISRTFLCVLALKRYLVVFIRQHLTSIHFYVSSTFFWHATSRTHTHTHLLTHSLTHIVGSSKRIRIPLLKYYVHAYLSLWIIHNKTLSLYKDISSV